MSKRRASSKASPTAGESGELFGRPQAPVRDNVPPPKPIERSAPLEAVPLDDFDFPPELQLPSMEELLQPPTASPGARASSPALPPLPATTTTPPRPPRVADNRTLANLESAAADLRSAISEFGAEVSVLRKDLPAIEPPSEEADPDVAVAIPVADDVRAIGSAMDAAVAPPATDAGEDARAPRSAAPAVSAFAGVLFVGDVHLSHRIPGFRCDDYPRAILQKLRWAIDYAHRERLLPVLLGDLFDFPRDNANWLLVELHHLLDPQTPAIYGNHDCKENSPGDHDTVSILVASGLLRLVSAEHPWIGTMNGCEVVIGGTSWGQKLPSSYDRAVADSSPVTTPPSYVLWATHHDLRFPGFEEAGRLDCRDVPGVDLVVNGHIHRELRDVSSGRTRWMNPGSLCRIARSDATRDHSPGVLRVDVSKEGLACRRVAVPHQPFDEVFHPDVRSEPVEIGKSLFIRDLEKLQAMRTGTGMGLREFLDANVGQFAPVVAAEIRALAEEVLSEA